MGHDEFGDWVDVRPVRQTDLPALPPRSRRAVAPHRAIRPQAVEKAEREDAGREQGEPFEELQ
jgi:hypothetical protein